MGRALLAASLFFASWTAAASDQYAVCVIKITMDHVVSECTGENRGVVPIPQGESVASVISRTVVAYDNYKGFTLKTHAITREDIGSVHYLTFTRAATD